MRVFVTGGSSPLGELVVATLNKKGITPLCLVRSDAGRDRVVAAGGEILRGAIEDRHWSSASRSADVVVHLAGIRFAPLLLPGVRADQRLVVTSSASAANSSHPLASLVAENERLMCRFCEMTMFRPTMIYGSARDRNMQRLARFVYALPAVPSFDGGHQIQPVASVDVADAVVEALSRPAAGVVDAGGPNAVRFGALVDALCELLGKRRLNLTLPVGSISRLARALPGARRSRLVHSAAMLGTDRTVAPLPPQLIGRAPTDLRQGLQAALVNYGLQVARPDADL